MKNPNLFFVLFKLTKDCESLNLKLEGFAVNLNCLSSILICLVVETPYYNKFLFYRARQHCLTSCLKRSNLSREFFKVSYRSSF